MSHQLLTHVNACLAPAMLTVPRAVSVSQLPPVLTSTTGDLGEGWRAGGQQPGAWGAGMGTPECDHAAALGWLKPGYKQWEPGVNTICGTPHSRSFAL